MDTCEAGPHRVTRGAACRSGQRADELQGGRDGLRRGREALVVENRHHVPELTRVLARDLERVPVQTVSGAARVRADQQNPPPQFPQLLDARDDDHGHTLARDHGTVAELVRGADDLAVAQLDHGLLGQGHVIADLQAVELVSRQATEVGLLVAHAATDDRTRVRELGDDLAGEGITAHGGQNVVMHLHEDTPGKVGHGPTWCEAIGPESAGKKLDRNKLLFPSGFLP